MLGDSVIAEILHEYGLIAILLIMLIEKVGPSVWAFIAGSKSAQQKRDHEKAQNAEALAVEDKRRAMALEERQIKAMETIAQNSAITRQLVDSLTDMVEASNRRLESHERDTAAILAGIEVLLDRRKRGNIDRPTGPGSLGPDKPKPN